MDAVGPYRLDALVGRGTAGSVWRATRSGPVDQVLAVKRARADVGDDAAVRLRDEARTLAELDHPHIVRVIDVLDDGAGVAIVMSLARGGSLHDLLVERGRLTPGQTVAVLSRVADALASAHRQGVFHGDVKPANILFTTDGEPLLGDFGVAQHLTPGRAGLGGISGLGDGDDGDDGAAEPLAAIEGTAGYVDPALVETGRLDPRNDVYGLAVVAYLCLTGRLPHGDDDVRAVLARAEAGDHPSLRDDASVPPALAEVVEAALDRDPARRPRDPGALAAGLRASVGAPLVVLPGIAEAVTVPVDDEDAAEGVVAVHPSDDANRLPSEQPGAEAPSVPARGTRAFGPRPPRPDPTEAPRRPLVTGLIVLALLVGAVGAGVWLRARLGAEQATTSVAVDGRAEPRGAECAAFAPIDVPPGAEELTADFAGDGCPTQVVWDGQVMRFRADASESRPRSYQVAAEGGPGQLVIGDWDCDGADTPAFYQPGTGRVAYFSAVPEREGGEVEARTEDSGVVEGRAELVVGQDGDCDRVEVVAEA